MVISASTGSFDSSKLLRRLDIAQDDKLLTMIGNPVTALTNAVLPLTWRTARSLHLSTLWRGLGRTECMDAIGTVLT